jgi:hypothetical protein
MLEHQRSNKDTKASKAWSLLVVHYAVKGGASSRGCTVLLTDVAQARMDKFSAPLTMLVSSLKAVGVRVRSG